MICVSFGNFTATMGCYRICVPWDLIFIASFVFSGDEAA